MKRPIGFNKRAYRWRAFTLLIALVVTPIYWYQWLEGSRGLPAPIIGTAITGAILLLSEHRYLLLLLAIDTVVALGVVGFFRTLVTGKPMLPGLLILGLMVVLRWLLGGSRRELSWLFKEDTVADTSLMTLDLRSKSEGK